MPTLKYSSSLPPTPALLLAALLLAGCAGATTAAGGVPSAPSTVSSGEAGLSAGPAPAATAREDASSSPGPAGAAGKASQPAVGSSGGGKGFPYPMDAEQNAAAAELELGPVTGPGGGEELQVTVPTEGWIRGQQVFLYVGSRYAATLSGPGSSGLVQLPSGLSGLLTVSGFQFPGNDPAAPIDAYGTARVQVGG